MDKNQLEHIKKNLWRIVFAKAAIGKAFETCEHILKNNLTPDSPIYYQLVAAIFVLYARPFGSNNGAGRISKKFESYDSPDKTNLHDMLIHGRNNFFAHLNANAPLYDKKGQNRIGHLFLMSIIIEDMKDGTIKLHQPQIIGPQLTIETIPRIKSLVKDLLGALSSEEQKLLRLLAEGGYPFKQGRNEIPYE